jgi:hypothetical protein
MSFGNRASIGEVLQAHVLTETKGRQYTFLQIADAKNFPILESSEQSNNRRYGCQVLERCTDVSRKRIASLWALVHLRARTVLGHN